MDRRIDTAGTIRPKQPSAPGLEPASPGASLGLSPFNMFRLFACIGYARVGTPPRNSTSRRELMSELKAQDDLRELTLAELDEVAGGQLTINIGNLGLGVGEVNVLGGSSHGNTNIGL